MLARPHPHRYRIGRKRPARRDRRGRGFHDICPTGNRAYGITTTNDLAEYGEIRSTAESPLGTAEPETESDHLIENEQDPEPPRQRPKPFNKVTLQWTHTRSWGYRIHDDRCDLGGML